METNNLFANEPNMPNYYYLAREAEIVGKDLDDIVWWFLSAVEEYYNIIMVTIINRQIELIENRDQKEHPIPRGNQ